LTRTSGLVRRAIAVVLIAACAPTRAQLAVAWVIAELGITAAIVGARPPEQVRENAKAAQFKLSEDERGEVRKVFEGFETA
jgi:aryl-alcohol dehydrogenase-like predicted oxidoreductase